VEDFTLVKPINQNFEILVPTRNSEWYTNQGYEPLSVGIFKSSSKGVDLVIDIGAHVGMFTIVAAKANPKIPILAIEASKDNFNILQKNINQVGVNNVNCFYGVFGESDGMRSFQVTQASDNSGISGHVNSPTVKIEVTQGITGQALDIQNGLRILIKIDIEGYELEALKSLKHIISGASSPRILLEINPKMTSLAGYNYLEIIKFLFSLELRIFLLDDMLGTWSEITKKNMKRIGKRLKKNYANLYCIKNKGAISLLTFLHSGNLGGTEKSHCEFISDHISRGGMVSTYVHGDSSLIGPEIINNGSSFYKSLIENPWWVTSETTQERSLPIKKYFSRRSVKKLAWKIRNDRHDLVLTQSSVSPVGAQVAKNLNIPHVWWIREFGDLDHGFSFPIPINKLADIFLKYSEFVLFNSVATHNYFFPSSNDRAFVCQPYPRLGINNLRPFASSTNTFVLVGNINPRKGHEIVLRAMHICSLAGIEVKLRIVGTDHSNYIKDLLQLATVLGVDQNVFFVKETSDLDAIYSEIAGVIAPSHNEAFGRVPFEATAYGVPVIFSKSGGYLDYMVDGHNGLGFERGNYTDLAEKLASCLLDKMLMEKIVHNAQEELHKNSKFEESSKWLYEKFLNTIADYSNYQ